MYNVINEGVCANFPVKWSLTYWTIDLLIVISYKLSLFSFYIIVNRLRQTVEDLFNIIPTYFSADSKLWRCKTKLHVTGGARNAMEIKTEADSDDMTDVYMMRR